MLTCLAALLGCALVLGCAAWSLRVERSWTSPLFVVSLWFGVFVFADAIYTAATGQYGPGTYTRYPVGPDELGVSTALWVLAHGCFAAAYLLSSLRGGGARPAPWPGPGLSPARELSLWIIVLGGAAVTFGVVAWVFGEKVRAVGELTAVIAARNEHFSDGGGIFLAGIQACKVAVLLYLFSTLRRGGGAPAARWLLLVPVVAVDLLVGSRSALVYGFLLPLLIGVHHHRRRVRVGSLALAGVLAFVLVGVVYRTVTRDQYFGANRGVSLPTLLVQNLSSAPSFFWGGFEASSLDGTIDIVGKYGDRPPLLGSTLLAAVTAPIPRAVWPEKPRGANAVYTAEFYPAFYSHLNTEYSASFVGELFLNFRTPGIAVAFALLGGLCSFLYYRLRGALNRHWPALGTLIYALVLSRTLGLFRGDAFNFSAQLALSLLNLAWICLAVYACSALLESLPARSGAGRRLADPHPHHGV